MLSPYGVCVINDNVVLACLIHHMKRFFMFFIFSWHGLLDMHIRIPKHILGRINFTVKCNICRRAELSLSPPTSHVSVSSYYHVLSGEFTQPGLEKLTYGVPHRRYYLHVAVMICSTIW